VSYFIYKKESKNWKEIKFDIFYIIGYLLQDVGIVYYFQPFDLNDSFQYKSIKIVKIYNFCITYILAVGFLFAQLENYQRMLCIKINN
jgi:hypothetical protein